MKLDTEQLLGTLELLSEPLQVYDEEIGGSYTIFYWDASRKGEFNLWNLMINEKYVQPISPEVVISQWILDEWLNPIEPYNIYEPRSTQREKFLNVDSKVIRYKAFQKLYELLNSKLQKLDAFIVLNSLYILVGEVIDNVWIVITPSAAHLLNFPYWISCSNLEIEKNNSQDILQLESTVKHILNSLSFLQFSMPMPDGLHTFDYYYSYAFAKTKIAAFIQTLTKAKIVQIKRFISLSSDYNQHFYNDDKRRKTIYVLNQFFQQKLSNVTVYYFTKYDNDYTYIIGETSDKNWLGVKISRSYRYY